VLVEEPRGALPGQPPGSARYSPDLVDKLAAGVVLLYVGRFTAVKRLDRLIGAFKLALEQSSTPAGLVLVGGHPGECEGEHPAQIAERLRVQSMFLAGWQPHELLPEFFAAGDVVVMASEREQFGQILIEGMACGLPAVATRSLGPASIIDDGHDGWLALPDERALAQALVEAIDDERERARRGRLARAAACERFSWTEITAQLAEVLEAAATPARGRTPRSAAPAPDQRGRRSAAARLRTTGAPAGR
jgi:glycosyltransferase involved in cell wall biosynthesis